MQVRAHIVVEGLVQGVGFRFFVYRQATKLGVSGWVRNLFNGDVEVEVEGERSSLEVFIGELKVGPRAAHIQGLHVDWQPFENKYASFEIR